jgi:lipoprotein-releasing system permease protein
MFETLVAWKYLFQPRFAPPVVAWLTLSLIELAAGAVLYYKIPEPEIAMAIAAIPVWLIFAVALPVKLFSSGSAKLSGAYVRASGTVGLFLALLLATYLLESVWKGVFVLSFVLPAAAWFIVWIAAKRMQAGQSQRPKTLQPWLIRLGLLAAAGLLAAQIRWSWSDVSVQYIGSFMVAGTGLLAVVLFLTCFFSVFTTISITGVILGAASLVMVRAVTRGFGREFQDKVLGFNAHVLVMKNTYGFTEYPQVMDMVRKLDHVTGAAPFTIAEMIITYENEHTTVLMKGVDPRRVHEVLDLTKYVNAENRRELNQIMDGMNRHLDKGLVGPGQKGSCARFDEDGDPIPGAEKKCRLPGIMLGRGLGKHLGVKKGSVVRLISPTAELESYRSNSGSAARPPLARDFRVVGTFYCGFEEYDQKMAFVHLKAAQKFVNPAALPEEDNAVLGVEIKIDDIYAAGEVAYNIKRLLGRGDYRIVTWDQLNRPLFEALRTQKLIMTLIVFIMVLVAAFGILAALIMMVLNKTREIAILKAMGATAGGVSRVFQFAGVMVGMIGVGCGVGLGVLNCHFLSGLNFPLDPKVYLISRLPVLVDWTEMGTVLAAGLVLCFLSTLYPSHKASSFHPVDGLRYE